MTPAPVSVMRRLLVLACAWGGVGPFAAVSTAEAAPDEVYLTAEGAPVQMARTAPLVWSDHVAVNEKREGIFLDPAKTFQTVVGIGGAITDAAAETLAKLPADKQEEVVRAYYDSDRGIGYTLARTNIHSCDFSSESYTYVRDGDTALTSFSVAHDERFRLPLLRRALAAAGGQLKVFASPWSPPAGMKDNGTMLHGGKAGAGVPRNLGPLFLRVRRRLTAKRGVPIWAVTVQNELHGGAAMGVLRLQRGGGARLH